MLASASPIRYAARMATPKILDLDAQLGGDDQPANTRPFRLFGRDWTLNCDLNAFALSDLATGEPAAIVRFLTSVVVEDQREDFRNALAAQQNLSAERLGAIITALVEATSERPTTPPSGSGSGRPNLTSVRKSAGSSSRTQAGR